MRCRAAGCGRPSGLSCRQRHVCSLLYLQVPSCHAHTAGSTSARACSQGKRWEGGGAWGLRCCPCQHAPGWLTGLLHPQTGWGEELDELADKRSAAWASAARLAAAAGGGQSSTQPTSTQSYVPRPTQRLLTGQSRSRRRGHSVRTASQRSVQRVTQRAGGRGSATGRCERDERTGEPERSDGRGAERRTQTGSGRRGPSAAGLPAVPGRCREVTGRAGCERGHRSSCLCLQLALLDAVVQAAHPHADAAPVVGHGCWLGLCGAVGRRGTRWEACAAVGKGVGGPRHGGACEELGGRRGEALFWRPKIACTCRALELRRAPSTRL